MQKQFFACTILHRQGRGALLQRRWRSSLLYTYKCACALHLSPANCSSSSTSSGAWLAWERPPAGSSSSFLLLFHYGYFISLLQIEGAQEDWRTHTSTSTNKHQHQHKASSYRACIYDHCCLLPTNLTYGHYKLLLSEPVLLSHRYPPGWRPGEGGVECCQEASLCLS